MGGQVLSGIYDRFAGLFLLLCVMKTEGMNVKVALRYLDDVLAVCGSGSSILKDTYRSTASKKGVRLDKSGNRAKCQGPDTTVIALGVIFNTKNWKWRMDYENAAILLCDINRAISNPETDLKENECLEGKLQNVSALMHEDRYRMAPMYNFRECASTQLEEETQIWWITKLKRAISGLPIPHINKKSSGNIIYAWTDAAGPTMGHVRGVRVSIPGLGWTIKSWPTWMETFQSPVWDKELKEYEEFHTNKMVMLEELGVLILLSLLKQAATGKTLEVFVEGKGNTSTIRDFMSHNFRKLVAPESIL